MYEQDMVKCTNCGDFPHVICYQIKLSEKFECAKCKQKNGCETGNKEIDLYKKEIDRTMKRKSLFINSTEDKCFNCQPGLEHSTEFMKIRFGFSSSYVARITLDLVKCQFITFFGSFNFNAKMIIKKLGITTGLSDKELQREKDVESY